MVLITSLEVLPSLDRETFLVVSQLLILKFLIVLCFFIAFEVVLIKFDVLPQGLPLIDRFHGFLLGLLVSRVPFLSELLLEFFGVRVEKHLHHGEVRLLLLVVTFQLGQVLVDLR